MIDPHEIQYIIRITLKKAGVWSRASENLVLLTGAAESGYEELIQGKTNKGAARSFWQVEPFTAIDNFKNYLNFQFKEDLRNNILKASNVNKVNLSKSDMSYLLTTNIAFALLMCRVKYLRDPRGIPKDEKGLAKYWKDIYNSSSGAGSVKKFLARTKYFADMMA